MVRLNRNQKGEAMFRRILIPLTLSVFALASLTARATPVNHAEASEGDFPDLASQSVVYPLSQGPNIFSGSMSNGRVRDLDSFAFSVPEGTRVVAISLSLIQRPEGAGTLLGANYQLQDAIATSASTVPTEGVQIPATENRVFSQQLPLEAGVYELTNTGHSMSPVQSNVVLAADWVISLHVAPRFAPAYVPPADYSVVTTVADLNGNGFPEIVTNRVGQQVILKDSKTGDWVGSINFFKGASKASWNPIVDLGAFSAAGDGNNDRLVALAAHGSTGNLAAEIYNPATGAKVARFRFFPDGDWDPIALTTGDVDEDGAPDITVMARRISDQRVAVEHRRASNGRLVGKRVWFSR